MKIQVILDIMEQPSPFLIPTIFESFSKNLSWRDLFRYKLVCKEWCAMINYSIDSIRETTEGNFVITTPIKYIKVERKLAEKWPGRYKELTINQSNNNQLTNRSLLLFKILCHKKLAYISTLSIVNSMLPKVLLHKLLTRLEPHLHALKVQINAFPFHRSKRRPFLIEIKPQPCQNSIKQFRKYWNITVLEITDWNFYRISCIEEISTAFPGLTDLTFNGYHCYQGLRAKDRIKCKKMSNLRRLSMQLSQR